MQPPGIRRPAGVTCSTFVGQMPLCERAFLQQGDCEHSSWHPKLALVTKCVPKCLVHVVDPEHQAGEAPDVMTLVLRLHVVHGA